MSVPAWPFTWHWKTRGNYNRDTWPGCCLSFCLSLDHIHTCSPSMSHHQLKYSRLRNQCDRLVKDPTVEPGMGKRWQTASSLSNSACTSPGKPVKDLIKYDSHKNADIASFLWGDNKTEGGRNTEWHGGSGGLLGKRQQATIPSCAV